MSELNDIISHFKSLKNETTYKHNIKCGVGGMQYGVKLGDIKALAKKIKTNHKLGLELWQNGFIECQLLATLIINPALLTIDEMNQLVCEGKFSQVADWLNSYIVKIHPQKEELRLKWMVAKDPMAARAGWNITAGMVAKSPEKLDLPALLDRLEKEMPNAAPEAQWTMNFTLAAIGIHHSELRAKALMIGESLGIYRDFPVSKGCTSPFAPIWINEIVKRQS